MSALRWLRHVKSANSAAVFHFAVFRPNKACIAGSPTPHFVAACISSSLENLAAGSWPWSAPHWQSQVKIILMMDRMWASTPIGNERRLARMSSQVRHPQQSSRQRCDITTSEVIATFPLFLIRPLASHTRSHICLFDTKCFALPN